MCSGPISSKNHNVYNYFEINISTNNILFYIIYYLSNLENGIIELTSTTQILKNLCSRQNLLSKFVHIVTVNKNWVAKIDRKIGQQKYTGTIFLAKITCNTENVMKSTTKKKLVTQIKF